MRFQKRHTKSQSHQVSFQSDVFDRQQILRQSMCLFKRGKKGITILGINVTIPSLEIAINQSLFKFTQKGSYITKTLVFPNMFISISIQCEANGGGPVVFVVTVHIIKHFVRFQGYSVFLHSQNIQPIFNASHVCGNIQWVSTRFSINKRIRRSWTNIQ